MARCGFEERWVFTGGVGAGVCGGVRGVGWRELVGFPGAGGSLVGGGWWGGGGGVPRGVRVRGGTHHTHHPPAH